MIGPDLAAGHGAHTRDCARVTTRGAEMTYKRHGRVGRAREQGLALTGARTTDRKQARKLIAPFS